jgi:hypothetical protein
MISASVTPARCKAANSSSVIRNGSRLAFRAKAISALSFSLKSAASNVFTLAISNLLCLDAD